MTPHPRYFLPEPMFHGQKNVYPMGIRAKDAAPDPGLPAGRTATAGTEQP